MTDVLDYIVPPQQFSEYFHLNSTENALYAAFKPGQVWFMKAASGFPSDMFTFDSEFVYAKLAASDTVNGWTDPHVFQAFVSKSWPGGGVGWAPRYFNPAVPPQPLVSLDTSFQINTSCSKFTLSNLGRVSTLLILPFELSLGGDLPNDLMCVSVYYQWNNGQTMETHTYGLGYGLVEWATANLVNGSYVTQKKVTFNQILPGGSPAVNFPCVIP